MKKGSGYFEVDFDRDSTFFLLRLRDLIDDELKLRLMRAEVAKIRAKNMENLKSLERNN